MIQISLLVKLPSKIHECKQSFYYNKCEKTHRVKWNYLVFCSRVKTNLTVTGIESDDRQTKRIKEQK